MVWGWGILLQGLAVLRNVEAFQFLFAGDPQRHEGRAKRASRSMGSKRLTDLSSSVLDSSDLVIRPFQIESSLRIVAACATLCSVTAGQTSQGSR